MYLPSPVKRKGNVIGFFGELNALSNFHPACFVLDGITFPTSEHYIQYTKAMCFGDRTAALNILNAATPADSKNLGWKISNFDKDKWDENAKALCYPGIREKFMQNKALLETLLRTRGHKLVESAKDKVWGTGIVLSRDDWHDATLWDSQGILGEMLTEIRDTYLDAHPHVQVLPLTYKTRLQQKVPMDRPNAFATSSNSYDEMDVSGVPPPTPVAEQNRPMGEFPMPSRSNPEISKLPGVPDLSCSREQNVNMQHSSSYPNLDVVCQDHTNSDTQSDPSGPSGLASSDTMQMEQPVPAMNSQYTNERKSSISHTQSALLSLAETSHETTTT